MGIPREGMWFERACQKGHGWRRGAATSTAAPAYQVKAMTRTTVSGIQHRGSMQVLDSNVGTLIVLKLHLPFARAICQHSTSGKNTEATKKRRVTFLEDNMSQHDALAR